VKECALHKVPHRFAQVARGQLVQCPTRLVRIGGGERLADPHRRGQQGLRLTRHPVRKPVRS